MKHGNIHLFSKQVDLVNLTLLSDTCGTGMNHGEIEHPAGTAQPELTLPRLEYLFNISCLPQPAGPTYLSSTSCYVTADVFFARVAQLVRAEES